MKQGFPKISIITPSFNQGNFIEETILSIIGQGYPNLEFIIIDGGSTDNTISIIKKYEKDISYWISEKDEGQTHAINKGFEKCTGEIVNWINSDDLMAEGSLFYIAKAFSEGGINVLCGKEYGFYKNTASGLIPHAGTFIGANVYDSFYIGIIDQPCTFFRRKSIETFFPLSTELRYVMDKELWWKFLLYWNHTGIFISDQYLTFFRLHEQSKSIMEGQYFQQEIVRLHLSLLRFLGIPLNILTKIDNTKILEVNWRVRNISTKYLNTILLMHYSDLAYRNQDYKLSFEIAQFILQDRHCKAHLKTLRRAVLSKGRMLMRKSK